MNNYFLKWLPTHLAEIKDESRLAELLTNDVYKQKKFHGGFTDILFRDFEKWLILAEESKSGEYLVEIGIEVAKLHLMLEREFSKLIILIEEDPVGSKEFIFRLLPFYDLRKKSILLFAFLHANLISGKFGLEEKKEHVYEVLKLIDKYIDKPDDFGGNWFVLDRDYEGFAFQIIIELIKLNISIDSFSKRWEFSFFKNIIFETPDDVKSIEDIIDYIKDLEVTSSGNICGIQGKIQILAKLTTKLYQLNELEKVNEIVLELVKMIEKFNYKADAYYFLSVELKNQNKIDESIKFELKAKETYKESYGDISWEEYINELNLPVIASPDQYLSLMQSEKVSEKLSCYFEYDLLLQNIIQKNSMTNTEFILEFINNFDLDAKEILRFYLVNGLHGKTKNKILKEQLNLFIKTISDGIDSCAVDLSISYLFREYLLIFIQILLQSKFEDKLDSILMKIFDFPLPIFTNIENDAYGQMSFLLKGERQCKIILKKAEALIKIGEKGKAKILLEKVSILANEIENNNDFYHKNRWSRINLLIGHTNNKIYNLLKICFLPIISLIEFFKKPSKDTQEKMQSTLQKIAFPRKISTIGILNKISFLYIQLDYRDTALELLIQNFNRIKEIQDTEYVSELSEVLKKTTETCIGLVLLGETQRAWKEASNLRMAINELEGFIELADAFHNANDLEHYFGIIDKCLNGFEDYKKSASPEEIIPFDWNSIINSLFRNRHIERAFEIIKTYSINELKIKETEHFHSSIYSDDLMQVSDFLRQNYKMSFYPDLFKNLLVHYEKIPELVPILIKDVIHDKDLLAQALTLYGIYSLFTTTNPTLLSKLNEVVEIPGLNPIEKEP